MNASTQTVFAIDIGTRKVCGLIVEYQDDLPKLKHYVLKEHQERTMEDGQIHDVPKVAQLVQTIKEELEEACGQELKAASVAAAGRSLKTVHGSSRLELLPGEVLSEDRVRALELAAVNEALKAIASREKQTSDSFFCVGYSTIGYTLDQVAIGNLVGQKGRFAGVEVIATFLPRMVVDSLTAVLQRAQLEFASMTLEPIAASHVAIPKDMRRLNLALVDIGAGTSDIAITADGAVIAYGMVPKAGDEITDHLCESLLVDFLTGEELKRNFSLDESEFIYTDILGQEQIISKEDLAELIKEATNELASSIASEILRLNTVLPQAVILVGGGSLTPFIAESLADALEIDLRRIGRRGKEVLKKLGIEEDTNEGPIFVTPIGIALSSHEGMVLEFHNVYLNGNMLSLLGERLTVGDALINGGFSTVDIYGAVGCPLTVYFNKEPLIIPGQRGQKAKILLNGEVASLDRQVKEGDKIEIEPAKVGPPGQALLKDILDDSNFYQKAIVWQGEKILLSQEILVNGKKESLDYELKEGDIIEIVPVKTVKDALRILEIQGQFSFSQIEKAKNNYYYLNEQKIDLGNTISLRLNGKEIDLDTPINSGDGLSIISNQAFPRLYELVPESSNITIQASIGGQKYLLPFAIDYEVSVNGNKEIPGYRVKNQDRVKIVPKKQPIVADVLALLKDELAKLRFIDLNLTVNGVEAQFTTILKDNDHVVVEGWR